MALEYDLSSVLNLDVKAFVRAVLIVGRLSGLIIEIKRFSFTGLVFE